MAAPAAKRRKVDHVSSDEEEDVASYASFGSEDEHGEGHEDLEANGVNKNISEGYGTEGSSGNGKPSVVSNKLKGLQARPSNRVASGPGSQNGAYAKGTFKSSLFKLQVDELLDQIQPKQGKREKEAEAALHKIKQTIDQMPGKEPLPVQDVETGLFESSKVVVPFPSPRPRPAANHKLAYAKPASTNVVGSHALKTASRSMKSLEIDMVVVMPSSMFQEKDYLNHRYFYKRAYYLACLAAGLKSAHNDDFQLRYENFQDDPLKPVIVITPKSKLKGHSDAASKPKWRINLIPCISEDTFNSEKMLPNKNCVRDQSTDAEQVPPADSAASTPFYNSSLRADMLMTSYLKTLHGAAKTCDSYRDACLLGRTWLQQRGLGSSIHAGGFGAFEWSALVALLLQGGGPGGRSILSDRYSSYQLLKATLQLLATRDLTKQPLVINSGDGASIEAGNGSPKVWDGVRSHNLLYKMTPWSYKKLRNEARTTLKMLNDSNFDGFEAAFILRVDNDLYKYDHVIELSDSAVDDGSSRQDYMALESHAKLYDVLQRGLGDRVEHLDIIPQWTESWDIDTANRGATTARKLRIGLVVDPDTVNRTVDHGPSAEQKEQAAAFRKFWGDKAELRRFKDGSILETVVWQTSTGQTVFEQIVRYLLQRRFGDQIIETATVSGGEVTKNLPHGSASTLFAPTMEGFKQFETDIRGLEGLPLSIRQIGAADPQLRHASIEVPTRALRPKPANIVLQFEGSARWPDDLVAIQRTKIAFLLKLSQLILDALGSCTARIGLENDGCQILNQAFLDVIYDSGAAFRVRIHHDREQTLLERMLKDKALEPSVKDTVVLGLAMYKRDYIKAPAHTQAFAGLCSRHPALSGTVRLLKLWFASHLLSNHIAEEVVELIAARTFVQPWPWQAPSSVQTGFYRTLNWLARWDWRNDPLIVDLSAGGDLKPAEMQSIATTFEAWRKLDPVMNRVVFFAASNVDPDGTTWTDGRSTKVVAGRMSALAKAARAEIEEKQLLLEPASLFSSPLSDFDFVVHLDPELGGKKRKAAKKEVPAFKNLEIDMVDDESNVGFDPLLDFTTELEQLYGSAVLFFSGGHERTVIAGLWNPQTALRPWTLNLSYSTTPVKLADKEKMQAKVNRDAILAEIARLGGEIVRRIEVNRH